MRCDILRLVACCMPATTECSHSEQCMSLCYLILQALAALPLNPLLRLHVRRSVQVHVLRQNGGAIAPLLARAGQLQELRLAFGRTVGLPQLLSGLSGLERLAIPGMRLSAFHGALSCLSELTQLTGECCSSVAEGSCLYTPTRREGCVNRTAPTLTC